MNSTRKSDHEIIVPPTHLKDRVTKRSMQGADFSPVDDVIETLSKDFQERLPKDIAQIENAMREFEKKPHEDSLATVLFRHVHDLKGQAGTFGYDLISVIGNDLCRFIERPIEWSERRLRVVHYHIEALKFIAKHDITGLGGQKGQKMVDTLQSMSLKTLQE